MSQFIYISLSEYLEVSVLYHELLYVNDNVILIF